MSGATWLLKSIAYGVGLLIFGGFALQALLMFPEQPVPFAILLVAVVGYVAVKLYGGYVDGRAGEPAD